MSKFKSSVPLVSVCAAICLMAGCGGEDKDVSTQDNNASCSASGSMRCISNNVMTCNGSSWVLKTACQSDQQCNPNTYTCDREQLVFVCNEGAIRCDGKESYKCDQNKWQKVATCNDNEACNAETGACEVQKCIPGNRCTDTHTLYKCSVSGQESTENCGDKVCDASLGECVSQGDLSKMDCTLSNNTELKNGLSVCDNSNFVTCADGELISDECGDGQVCREGENACSALKSCEVNGQTIQTGEKGCNADKNVVLCVDGKLNVRETCGDGTVCMLAAGEYSCKKPSSSGATCEVGGLTVDDGAKVCDGNVLKTCTSGQLDAGSNCADTAGTSLCKGAECVAAPCAGGIASGYKTCNEGNTQIVICKDGKFENATGSEACTSGQYCQSGNPPKCVDKGSVKIYTKIKDIHADFDAITSLNPKGCMDNGKDYMTTADVSIEGVVTATKTNGFFVQDPSETSGKNAGIMVNCVADNCDLTGFSEKLDVGDHVKVTSKYVGYNKCQLWVRTKGTDHIAVEKTSGTDLPPVITVPLKSIKEGVHNEYNGTLVTINNISVISCDTKKCLIKDDNDDQNAATNYINTKAVTIINNHMSKGVSKFNMSGIVYYNDATLATNIGPSVITPLNCTGTEKKCENNKQYNCVSSTWVESNTCKTDIDNANPVCASNGVDCSFECKNEFDVFDPKTGKCVASEGHQSCTDVNGLTVADGKNGCKDNFSRATCRDGNWEGEYKCWTDHNATTTCVKNWCNLTCNDGYTKSSDGKSCIKVESGGAPCKDVNKRDVMSGYDGCIDGDVIALCENGEWVDEWSCPEGCNPEAFACFPSMVNWCLFAELKSDGSEAYVKTVDPDGGESVYGSVACILKANDKKAYEDWTLVKGTDATSSCLDCGKTKHMYKVTGLPSAAGEYSCVAVVTVDGGFNNKRSYVCPKSDYGENTVDSITDFEDYEEANAYQILNYTSTGGGTVVSDKRILVKWDFEDKNLAPDDGLVMAKSSLSIKQKESPKYDYYQGWNGSKMTGSAVSSNGWADTLFYGGMPYWSITLDATGYKNLSIDFDVYGSSATNKAIYVAYKTEGGFAAVGTPEAFVDTKFHSERFSLPAALDNTQVEIGIFPVTETKTVNIRLDNIVVSGLAK